VLKKTGEKETNKLRTKEEKTSKKISPGQRSNKNTSKRKIAEGALKKLNTELEKRITERTEEIEAINKERQVLSDLLMYSSQPFGIGYPDGSFGLHNVALRELIGYSEEEMKTIKWPDITPLEWLKDEAKMLEELERTGQPVHYEKEYIRKDGSRVPIELLIHRTNDESGNLQYYYAFITDITERKQAEVVLKQREKDLEKKTRNIEEANIALKVLLKRRDGDRRELEEKVLLNIRELVHPYLEKLKMSGLDENQMTYMNILEANLNEITLPFSQTLTSRFLGFTPKEIQIANLLRQGKTNKEIGRLLNSSPRTIAFHRENIRKKFGLKNKKANLKSYLLSLPK
jgi:PAS domain S-box-containing protein